MSLGMGFIHFVISAAVSCALIAVLHLILKAVRKKSGKEFMIGNKAVFFVLWLAVSALSGIFADKTVNIYDRVTVTALGRCNEESISDEIRLSGILANGKEYSVRPPLKGKWFWIGDNYVWRNESSPHQPKGTTKTIVIEIPAGIERSLTFDSKDMSRGIAEIKYGGNVYTADTSKESSVDLPRSSSGQLALFILLYALCNAGLLILMGSAALLLTSSYEKTNTKIYRFRYNFTYAAIAVSSMLIYMPVASKFSFWRDEMCQIAFSGCGRSLYETLAIAETSPPIYRLIANIWYNIVPYGEQWLALLSAVFAVCGIYSMGLLGKEYRNAYVGTACAAMSAVSFYVCRYAVEFRNYSLLFMLSALYMLFTLKRIKKGKNAGWRDFAGCVIVGVLLSYTHYFGIFLMVCTCAIDFFLWVTKRIKLKTIFVYLIPLILYIPWLIYFFRMGFLSEGASWQKVPNFLSVIELLSALSGNDTFVFLLLILGASFAAAYCIKAAKSKNANSFRNCVILAVPVAEILLMISLLMIYGNIINRSASLWSARYFIVILPSMLLLVGSGIETAALSLKGMYKKGAYTVAKTTLLLAAAAYVFSTTYSNMNKATFKTSDQYREGMDWLYSQDIIYDDTTLVVYAGNGGNYIGGAVYEYYAVRQGARDDINYITVTDIPADCEEFLSQYTDIFIAQPVYSTLYDGKVKSYILGNYDIYDSNYKIDYYKRIKM